MSDRLLLTGDGNRVGMKPGGSGKLLLMLILLEFSTGVWTLPAPGSLFMDSANMRHVLRWTQPQASCNTTPLYSVQYQGEFELHVKNGSWMKTPDCQRIALARCDLTLDLGSDSDYSLRVRAQCGSELSAWANFHFNRNNVTPPVPEIKVTTAGGALLVSVRKFPLTAATRVTVWKNDGEQQAEAHLLPADQEALKVPGLQEGAVYCVRAQVFLRSGLQSGFTERHCVSVAGPGAPAWKQPTAVTVTVVFMLGLLVVVFWSVVHCRPASCHRFFQKEPLPPSLKEISGLQVTILLQGAELCEETPRLLSAEQT